MPHAALFTVSKPAPIPPSARTKSMHIPHGWVDGIAPGINCIAAVEEPFKGGFIKVACFFSR